MIGMYFKVSSRRSTFTVKFYVCAKPYKTHLAARDVYSPEEVTVYPESQLFQDQIQAL